MQIKIQYNNLSCSFHIFLTFITFYSAEISRSARCQRIFHMRCNQVCSSIACCFHYMARVETVGLAEDAQDDGDGSQRDSDTDGVKQRAYVGQHNVLWGGLMDCQFASCQLTGGVHSVPHVLSLLPPSLPPWLADFWFSFYKRQKRQQKSINVNGDKLIKLRQKDFA